MYMVHVFELKYQYEFVQNQMKLVGTELTVPIIDESKAQNLDTPYH